MALDEPLPEHQPLLLSTTKGSADSNGANSNGGVNYGALRPASNTSALRPHKRRHRLVLVMAVVLLMLVLLLTILTMVVRQHAQKVFEQGIQLSFEQTSIEKITGDTLTLHVIGTVTLLAPAYELGQRLGRLFRGGIQLDPAQLQVSNLGMIDLPGFMLSSTNVTSLDFVTQFVVGGDDDQAAAMVAFCKDAMELDKVGWQVSGTLVATVGWLPLKNHVSLNKWIDIDGMAGLKQTEMKNMAFPGTHPLGGIALGGLVGIYNPSKTLSMTLGDVDFGIYLSTANDNTDDDDAPEEMIAVVRAQETQLLSQRMNYFTVTGRTLPLLDGDKTAKRQLMEHFLTQYLHGNTSMVRVRGNAFGPDDEIRPHQLPNWLQKSLASITLTMPFPGTNQPQLIQSLTMGHLQIDFSMGNQQPLVSGDTVAYLHLPNELQVDVAVTEIEPDVYLYLDPTSDTPFARLRSTHPTPSVTAPLEDALSLKVSAHIDKAPLQILQPGLFDQFLLTVYRGNNATLFLQGTTAALVKSDFGTLKVHDLAFQGQIKTTGMYNSMRGMKHPSPKVTSLAILQGYTDALQVQPCLEITNPSDIDMNLGVITFAMLYKGIEIGNVTIGKLNLARESNNAFDSKSFIFATPRGTCGGSSAMLEFIGDYISGRQTELVIAGRPKSGSKYLAGLMPYMVFTVQVPRFIQPPLLQAIQMNLLSSTALVWLRNPFEDLGMRIKSINASALYEERLVSTMDYLALDDNGLALPPVVCMDGLDTNCTGVVVVTPKMPVAMKKFGLDLISKALGGKLILSIDSIVNVMIDNFRLSGLHYKRDNITAIIKKSF